MRKRGKRRKFKKRCSVLTQSSFQVINQNAYGVQHQNQEGGLNIGNAISGAAGFTVGALSLIGSASGATLTGTANASRSESTTLLQNISESIKNMLGETDSQTLITQTIGAFNASSVTENPAASVGSSTPIPYNATSSASSSSSLPVTTPGSENVNWWSPFTLCLSVVYIGLILGLICYESYLLYGRFEGPFDDKTKKKDENAELTEVNVTETSGKGCERPDRDRYSDKSSVRDSLLASRGGGKTGSTKHTVVSAIKSLDTLNVNIDFVRYIYNLNRIFLKNT